MTAIDPITQGLVARYKLAGAPLDGELALLMSLPPEKIAVVVERLKVIDRFLKTEPSGVKQANEAAAELNIAPRNFYRLVSRVREFGAVRALAPRFRNKASVAPTQAGLPPVAESEIRQYVAGPQEMALEDLVRLVIHRAKEAGEKPPSASGVRRRIEALRRQGFAVKAGAVLGRQLIFDQIVVDLPVAYPNGVERPVATFILDRQTLLVIGSSLSRKREIGAGFMRAFGDLQKNRLTDLVENTNIPLSENVETIDWVVDFGLDERIDEVKKDADLLPYLTLNIHVGPRRRAGSLVTKFLGDRLGTLPFVLRSGREMVPGERAVSPRVASDLLSTQVTIWNAEAIERLDQADWSFQADAKKRQEAIEKTILYGLGGIVGGKVKPLVGEIVEEYERGEG